MFSQREHYCQKFRPLAFMIGTAVKMGVVKEVLGRIREINGEMPSPSAESFKHSLFKDYSTGISRTDMATFIQWFIQDSVSAVKGREKVQRELQRLKHSRLAWLHVHCTDSRVPEHLSMLHPNDDSALILPPLLRDPRDHQEADETSHHQGDVSWQCVGPVLAPGEE